jgi:hypothetical protein
MTEPKRAGLFAKPRMYGITMAVIFLTVVLVIFCLQLGLTTVKRPIPFNSVVWKKEGRTFGIERTYGNRWCMISDLLSKHTLVGMTRGDIDDLLGKPDLIDNHSEYDYNYRLGREHPFIWSGAEGLGIRFKDDIVTKAQTWAD